ncbi:MAG: SprB repeat-containing protein, partial [Saprospiraceae bacterium]
DTLPFVTCILDATLNSTTPVQCFGTSTGSAIVSVSNANPPVQFLADGQGPSFVNGDLLQVFPVGPHFVVVGDQTGCRDTVFFVLTQPDSLALSVTPTDAICNGDNSGTASASATGGTGTIDFQWQGCLGGPKINLATATGLLAGCYSVTATDANGCTAIDSVNIGEPPGYQFMSIQTPVSCFGGMDGSIGISVTGSTPPYTYLWDDGQMSDTAVGLGAGFHIVTVTDAMGCQAATLVQLPEPPLLVVDSTSSRPVSCFGGDNGTATVFSAGGTPPYQYLWNDLQNTQKAVGLAAGMYSVTVRDANDCTVVATVPVGSPTALVVNFANINPEKCAGDCQGAATVLATGGMPPYNYTWDSPLITNGEDMPTALCPGDYLVTVEDTRGCTQIDKLTIDAAVPIDVHYDPTAPTCSDLSDGSVTTTVAGGSPPYAFLWSNGSTDPSPVNLTCGDYTVTLTDAAGCVKIEAVQVVCPTTIQVISLVSEPVTCFGLSDGSLLVNTQGGTGILTYLWSDPTGQTDSLAQNLPAGTYTVTITDSQGCSISTTGNVIQPDLLVVNLTSTDVRCYGGSDGLVTALPAGGKQPYQYAWNPLATDSVLVNLSTGNYAVTVQDANGCTANASIHLDQPADPVIVTVMQTHFACYGAGNNEAQAVAMGNNGPPYIFTWGDGQTGTTATNLPVGSITVTATDTKGCYSSQVLDVKQLDSIKVNVVYAPPLCFGAANAIAGVNAVQGGAGMGDTLQYNYQWSVAGAANAAAITGLSGGQTYRLTVTDVQGCSGKFSFDIPQAPEITLTMTVQDVLCFGQSNGAITINGSTGGTLPVTYIWDDNTTGPQITNLSAGAYQVTATDAKQCSTVKLIEVKEPLRLTIDFHTTPLVCSSDKIATIAADIQGGIAPYKLQWNTGANTPMLSGLGAGNYGLTVSDYNGCPATDSIQILLPDSLMVLLQNTDPLCFGANNGRFQLTVTGGAIPYRYSLENGPFTGSSTFFGLQAGDYGLRVRDGHGCITELNATLTNPPPVIVALGADTTIILGQSVTLSPEINNAFGLTSNTWRSALLENLACVDTPACTDIVVQPLLTNTYFLTVTDAHGCTGRASQKVQVEKPRGVYVPTGFSPNGDLENDRLIVH